MAATKTFRDLGFRLDEVTQWYKIGDLLNEEILVLDFILVNGRHGIYALVKFNREDEVVLCGLSTGAKVIIEKLQLARDQHLLPLAGKVIKQNQWYDLV